MLLEQLQTSSDLRGLSAAEAAELAEDIRAFLLQAVSQSGGHLASNLGVVELTLALHAVFDPAQDRLVWDVGHQSYVHKLLTGRREQFSTLRQYGGLSGFPKRSESPCDAFNTGHSSTSVSAAIGLAKARDLRGGQESVVAIIGDGALTGGMAYEALNNAAAANTRLTIVLNDNAMSISENVGALSGYLNRLTNREGYFRFKSKLGRFLQGLPVGGESLFRFLQSIKNKIKYALLPGRFFSELGLKYYGPVDGHDFSKLKLVLKTAAEQTGPTLVHVCTQKGKGYSFAEEKPTEFHGISCFDPETGCTLKNSTNTTYSEVFGQELFSLAQEEPKLCAITAAMPCGTGLSVFAEHFPDRFFDVGIAEQHAVTFAAGLAAGGFIPVVAVYSTFLQRAYDQVLHDVALQNLPVIFALDRAGIVGEDGETHQGLYDLAYLSHIPNMTVLAPSDHEELRRMLRFAVSLGGPVAIRYPRGSALGAIEDDTPLTWGRGRMLRRGTDVALLALGSMTQKALEAEELLCKQGISATVADLRFAKPVDQELVLEAAKNARLVVVLEDATAMGGVSDRVMELLQGSSCRVLKKTFPDVFIPHGKMDLLYETYGLDAAGIAAEIVTCLEWRA